MTRELKLALIVGFSLVLVVMVLVSDHLSKARKIELAPPTNETALAPKLPQADLLNPSAPNALGTSSGLRDPLASNTGTDTAVGAPNLNDPVVIGQGNSSGSIEEQKLSLQKAAERVGMATKDGNQTGMIVPVLSDTSSMLPPAPIASSDGVRPMGDGTTKKFANGSNGASLNIGTGTTDVPGMDKPVAAVSNDKIHVIESGQSLYGISKQYYGNSKYWKQLLEYNKGTLKSESALKIGMKIKVPDLATLTGKPADAAAPLNAVNPKNDPTKLMKDPVLTKIDAAKTGKGKTYTVVKGDTPGTIAKKALGTSKRAHELMNLNKIEDDGGLKIGMVLQLPE